MGGSCFSLPRLLPFESKKQYGPNYEYNRSYERPDRPWIFVYHYDSGISFFEADALEIHANPLIEERPVRSDDADHDPLVVFEKIYLRRPVRKITRTIGLRVDLPQVKRHPFRQPSEPIALDIKPLHPLTSLACR